MLQSFFCVKWEDVKWEEPLDEWRRVKIPVRDLEFSLSSMVVEGTPST